MKRNRVNYYYCRHCGKRYSEYAMAQLCFELDMKLLQNEQNEKPIKKHTK